ncbi:DUF2332 family protein [Nakamurella sp. YIM 132087]|uniref:DUF2332 family protein n=1 Tax=Nakamurella alba TaxID=2665158 RepID=A0A7K1FHM9_9ACTN|nr:DUF2332 domain-containing protein [Nakamurella alba]MTD13608.1 DUF2332 family protein [Nakamurella alba]
MSGARGQVSHRPARSLREIYLLHAEEVATTSPLSAAVAAALGRSPAAMDVTPEANGPLRRPPIVLAALHDLALSGSAPELAAAYAAGDPDAAGAAAVRALIDHADEMRDIVDHRRMLTDVTGRHAVLYPAIAEAARRAGATSIGLVDLGTVAGFNLVVDRVGLTYDKGGTRGDPASPVQRTCKVVGPGRIPGAVIPPVVTRVGIDEHPVDVLEPADARWLRACVAPDETARRSLLDAEIALVTAARPGLLQGDVIERVDKAAEQVPDGALPVVTSTWALSRLPAGDRLRFLQALDAAATHRTVAWVSVEGVGVAPSVPTMGDRPASGHSIIGLTLLDHRTTSSEALGRCWSRGRLMSWLAD